MARRAEAYCWYLVVLRMASSLSSSSSSSSSDEDASSLPSFEEAEANDEEPTEARAAAAALTVAFDSSVAPCGPRLASGRPSQTLEGMRQHYILGMWVYKNDTNEKVRM